MRSLVIFFASYEVLANFVPKSKFGILLSNEQNGTLRNRIKGLWRL